MTKVTTVVFVVYAAILLAIVIAGILSVGGFWDTGYDGPSI